MALGISVANADPTLYVYNPNGSSINAIGNGLTWQENNGFKNSMQTEKIVPIGSFLLSKTLFQHTTAMGDFK